MFEQHPYGKLIAGYIQNAEFPKQPADLYDPIAYILSLAGKRIRPMLVLMGAKLFGKDNLEEVLPASIAIEYFHNFSLIHDDIMDRAPLRRGKATVHQKWNDNVAILSGDALLVKAYQELGKSPADRIPSLLQVFSKIALEVCEGQQLDMDFEKMADVSEDDYLNMIRLKTSVLLGGALQMGAILAHVDEQQQQLIYDFGVNLGIAFQLQDDYLDVYGDPKTFGKQVGGDILCNKKTYLRIKTEHLIDSSAKVEFEELINSQDIKDTEKVSRMKNLYAQFNVDRHAEEIKLRFMELAYNKLEEIAVPESQKVELKNLADTLMHRTR
ncbi:isoprenyl synthetase [Sphingobacterium mizutaii NBRC 14946 = DSM 11724]|uniref:Farnesyl diphosphate synthase n=2 Tax=Sphingobacterium mizutaii TaxID=1010 RepID=A0AAJ5BZ78_9SPHI|nr:polyprenyl synthetase family protein [Sphingobacterium mizutaii]GEM67979.1 isoprenyl synthetase [Sphingobacterium mizutaii NBRC 14946 = DSM 11724]SDL37524.1 geranylgeranyl diphosphate synthase, type II [Sphingobacterium mizutaii]SNV43354.1 Farnesyl diphosphate synthase [Sphingobacterium mizutaii]